MKEECVQVEKGKKINITKEGMTVQDATGFSNEFNDQDGFVFPCNEDVIWEEDFYDKVWENDLQSHLHIMIQVKAIPFRS